MPTAIPLIIAISKPLNPSDDFIVRLWAVVENVSFVSKTVAFTTPGMIVSVKKEEVFKKKTH